MDTRQERGLQIAEARCLRRKGDLWIVPSQAGRGTYVVDSDRAPRADLLLPGL